MVQRYEQTRKLQWYKRGAAYPSFDKVTFNLENGRKFVIVAEGVDDENFYIQQVDLNGKSGYYLSHDDLLKGGKLSFRMGNSPKY